MTEIYEYSLVETVSLVPSPKMIFPTPDPVTHCYILTQKPS